MVSELVKKFYKVYVTRSFITVSSEAFLLSSSWAALIQSIYQNIFNFNFNIILQLKTMSTVVFFLQVSSFSTKIP